MEENRGEKSTQIKKRNNGLIIGVIILFLILALLIVGIFIKDKEGVSYLSKFKNLFIIQDNPNVNNKKNDKTNNNQKYNLNDYITINEKLGKNEYFKYQYVEFTSKLPDKLTSNFIQAQNDFMEKSKEQYYLQKELKTSAEIYNNVLFIYAIQRSYIEEMPISDSVYSLNINLENQTVLSDNDVIAMFDYNIEGIMYKVLEHMAENSNTDHYYFNDDKTIITLIDFTKRIPEYAQKLSNSEQNLAKLYIKDGKLYAGYIESSILIELDLTYDRFRNNETVTSFELEIINNEETLTY